MIARLAIDPVDSGWNGVKIFLMKWCVRLWPIGGSILSRTLFLFGWQRWEVRKWVRISSTECIIDDREWFWWENVQKPNERRLLYISQRYGDRKLRLEDAEQCLQCTRAVYSCSCRTIVYSNSEQPKSTDALHVGESSDRWMFFGNKNFILEWTAIFFGKNCLTQYFAVFRRWALSVGVREVSRNFEKCSILIFET